MLSVITLWNQIVLWTEVNSDQLSRQLYCGRGVVWTQDCMHLCTGPPAPAQHPHGLGGGLRSAPALGSGGGGGGFSRGGTAAARIAAGFGGIANGSHPPGSSTQGAQVRAFEVMLCLSSTRA